MATIPKPVPVPWESFQPSATEQIFARGVQDRDMSGLNYMLMNAAQGQREANHVQYSAGVDQANKQAADMFAREQAQAAMIEQLKVAAGLAKEGFLPSGMPAMAGVMTDPAANDDLGMLKRALMQADIASKNASAAGASGDTYQVEFDTTANGPGNVTYKAKGKDPRKLYEEMKRRAEEDKFQRNLNEGTPGRSFSLPTGVDKARALTDAEKAREAAKKRALGQ